MFFRSHPSPSLPAPILIHPQEITLSPRFIRFVLAHQNHPLFAGRTPEQILDSVRREYATPPRRRLFSL